MDFLACKELLLHGNLPQSSLHAHPAINNFTSTLIPLEVMACERISAMLHNKQMLAVPAASTLERHSIYEIAWTSFLPIHSHKRNLGWPTPDSVSQPAKAEPVNVDF
jgi:hypothetical protein